MISFEWLYPNRNTQELFKSAAHRALVDTKSLARISIQGKLSVRFRELLVLEEILNDEVRAVIKGILNL